MEAILLVGGRGTRLRPLTNTTPKPMLPIANVPMVERIIDAVRPIGVDRVVLSLGFQPDAFSDAYPDGRIAGIPVHYAVEPEPMDTGGAIAFAADAAGVDGEALVLNGDVIAERDLDGLVDLHRRSGAEATIALTKVDDPSAFGVVPTAEDGRVIGFIEKPPRHEAPTDWINAGTYLMAAEVLAGIPRGRRVSVERETFPALVERGTLYALHDPGEWLDTGTPAQFLQANLDAVDHADGVAVVDPSASVAPEAVVVRSVMGPRVVMEAGSSCRESVLMAGAVVGAGARVDSSLVGPGCVVGAGAVVENCVLGDDAVVEPGERLSGVRRPDPEAAA